MTSRRDSNATTSSEPKLKQHYSAAKMSVDKLSDQEGKLTLLLLLPVYFTISLQNKSAK